LGICSSPSPPPDLLIWVVAMLTTAGFTRLTSGAKLSGAGAACAAAPASSAPDRHKAAAPRRSAMMFEGAIGGTPQKSGYSFEMGSPARPPLSAR